MTSPQQQVIDKCKAVFALAKTLYNVDLEPKTSIRFDLKGRTAGTASGRFGMYTLRFNHDMLLRELEDMRDDTVPHEIAHLVCFARRELGSNHDRGWQRVCIALGGSGDRTHELDVVYGKGYTYEYVTDRGHKVRLGDRYHKAVQAGKAITYRKGLGRVTEQCAYSIVGVAGRTLAQPVVRKAVADPILSPGSRALIQDIMTRETTVQVTDTTGATPVHSLVILPAQQPTAPVATTLVPRVTPPTRHVTEGGTSKAAVSRNIMASGYRAGKTYEAIIAEMMSANGYNRQLARATFKANAARVNIPATWGN
jgi:SprT protein